MSESEQNFALPEKNGLDRKDEFVHLLTHFCYYMFSKLQIKHLKKKTFHKTYVCPTVRAES